MYNPNQTDCRARLLSISRNRIIIPVLITMVLSILGAVILVAIYPNFVSSSIVPTSTNTNAAWSSSILETENATTFLPIIEAPVSSTTEEATDHENRTSIESETETLHPGYNESSDTEPSLPNAFSTPSTTEILSSTNSAPKRPKCSIGSITYEEFNLDNIPAKSKRCKVKREIFANPERKNGDQLRRIVCEKRCAYYSAKITNFQYQTALTGLIQKARTLKVQMQGHCSEVTLPSNVFNTSWAKLNWLQIELQSPNECLKLYKAVSSWQMPKLDFLSFDRPYFSISNQEDVRQILQENANITSLRISQGLSGLHADIFSGIQLPKLTKADIRWRQEYMYVINQTKALVSSASGLTDFTLSLDLPVPEFIWISKQLKNLQNGQFGIFLRKSGSGDYHLSLSTTVGFDKIENLTLRISVDQEPENVAPITITDFQYLNPSLKCITIMTKGVYALNVASESRNFCTHTYSILQNGHLMKCCRN